MTFTSGQVLTAAQLNDLDIDSLTVGGRGTFNAGTDNTVILAESTDATARINLKDNSTSGNSR